LLRPPEPRKQSRWVHDDIRLIAPRLAEIIEEGGRAYQLRDEATLAKLEREYERIRGKHGEPDKIRPFLEKSGSEHPERLIAEIISMISGRVLGVTTVLDLMRSPGPSEIAAQQGHKSAGRLYVSVQVSPFMVIHTNYPALHPVRRTDGETGVSVEGW